MSYTVYAQFPPPRRNYQENVHRCRDARTARSEGHSLVSNRGKTYEVVQMDEQLTPISYFSAARVPIRNHTAGELELIRGVLRRLPDEHLRLFAENYEGIFCVDWTGQNWDTPTRPGRSTVLGGGARMRRTITRDWGTASGSRIELTHSCLHELRDAPYGRRGMFTLWHELGHVAYDNGLTPRRVQRENYGESIHTGPSEQPAYAYMWYYLNPSRLDPRDRAALDRLLGGSGGGRPEQATDADSDSSE